jgi:hypothetical protein
MRWLRYWRVRRPDAQRLDVLCEAGGLLFTNGLLLRENNNPSQMDAEG